MATAVMQVAALPLPGARRSSSCSVNITGIHSARAVKSRNGPSSSSRGLTRTGYGDKKQGSSRISMKKFYVVNCSSSEKATVKEPTDEDFEKQVQPDDVRILAAIRSRSNYITVMEVAREADHLLAGARILLLDNPGCIHTVYYQHNVLTNSYYDVLATVVPLLPEGEVAILGLGAGAVSQILHHFFPTLAMHGWELDPDIITIARQFFNMAELEGQQGKPSSSFADQVVAPGTLTVHIGDAVGADVCVEGGFAGLIVDLFAEGRVIPALQEPRTWELLKAKLKPGGRIIVNCGGDRVVSGEQTKSAGQVYMEQTVAAMGEVFAGELSTRYLARKGFNTIAITGPSPEVEAWTQALPEPLQDGISEWKPV